MDTKHTMLFELCIPMYLVDWPIWSTHIICTQICKHQFETSQIKVLCSRIIVSLNGAFPQIDMSRFIKSLNFLCAIHHRRHQQDVETNSTRTHKYKCIRIIGAYRVSHSSWASSFWPLAFLTLLSQSGASLVAALLVSANQSGIWMNKASSIWHGSLVVSETSGCTTQRSWFSGEKRSLKVLDTSQTWDKVNTPNI